MMDFAVSSGGSNELADVHALFGFFLNNAFLGLLVLIDRLLLISVPDVAHIVFDDVFRFGFLDLLLDLRVGLPPKPHILYPFIQAVVLHVLLNEVLLAQSAPLSGLKAAGFVDLRDLLVQNVLGIRI